MSRELVTVMEFGCLRWVCVQCCTLDNADRVNRMNKIRAKKFEMGLQPTFTLCMIHIKVEVETETDMSRNNNS